MSTQNNPTLHVCSIEDRQSKSIKVYENESHICFTYDSESKKVIVNACLLDASVSESFHISVNTSKVKDATNETKYEEPSVKYNSVANAFKCFKLFEHNKKFLNNIGAT